VRRVLGFGHPDCEDVAQLALLAFTQNLPAFRGECEPSHYASRLAVRAAVRAGRRERALRARFRSLSEVDEPESANLYDGVLAARRARIVHGLLDTIPPEQANALSLRAVLSWSLEEIAAASRSPVNTVRSRLRLAKTALRKRIETDPVLSDQLELPP
jgi:RNA polymerase sigma factor (sigma-70 family)